VLRATLLLPAREDRVTENLRGNRGLVKTSFRGRTIVSRRCFTTTAYTSERATNSGRKKTGKKKAAPKSGQVQGGNAQEGRRLHGANRNTAPQQYAGTRLCPQGSIYNHSRQNAAETLGKYDISASNLFSLLPFKSCLRCSKPRRLLYENSAHFAQGLFAFLGAGRLEGSVVSRTAKIIAAAIALLSLRSLRQRTAAQSGQRQGGEIFHAAGQTGPHRFKRGFLGDLPDRGRG